MKRISKKIKAVLGGLVFLLVFAVGGLATAQEGLIGYWPFDGSGADLSGGGRTLGLFGDVGFVPGLFGQALDLHGNPNQYAARPGDDQIFDFGAADFTLQVWVRFNQTSGEQTLLEKFSFQAGPGWTVTKLPGQVWRLHFDGAIVLDSAPQSIPSGVWHHVVVRRQGATFRILYDGSVVAQGSSTGAISDTGMPLLVGKRNQFDGRHFPVDGQIDEVAIWSRALSDAEIAFLFNGGNGNPIASDTDGDGIPDDEDNCPTIPNAPQADTDADGSGDACDACPADPFNDGDGDGICGNVDNCPNVVNPGQEDSDGDGVGNACNEADDPDGDDFATAQDNCPAVFNPNQADGDGDGFGDVCDVCPLNVENDADGDGICESDDNCPLTANANQLDSDQDGAGDACDPDDDNDGVLDAVDNCPLDANPDQGDADGDGAGNACDTDDDNDGVLDATDQCLSTAAGATVNPAGCSIADLCPCANDWKNHGAYVSCVAHTAEDFVAAGLITDAEKDALVAEAAQSNCGKK